MWVPVQTKDASEDKEDQDLVFNCLVVKRLCGIRVSSAGAQAPNQDGNILQTRFVLLTVTESGLIDRPTSRTIQKSICSYIIYGGSQLRTCENRTHFYYKPQSFNLNF